MPYVDRLIIKTSTTELGDRLLNITEQALYDVLNEFEDYDLDKKEIIVIINSAMRNLLKEM